MSQLLDELKIKFPSHKIISEPLLDCPKCKGKGEVLLQKTIPYPCLCTKLSTEQGDEFRMNVILKLQKAVKEVISEYKEDPKTFIKKAVNWAIEQNKTTGTKLESLKNKLNNGE